MSTPEFEAFLARLYVDGDARTRFLADPEGESRRAGLTEEQVAALAAIDKEGLAAAAASFSKKREAQRTGRQRGTRFGWLASMLKGRGIFQ